jgi:hypothetical protein
MGTWKVPVPGIYELVAPDDGGGAPSTMFAHSAPVWFDTIQSTHDCCLAVDGSV